MQAHKVEAQSHVRTAGAQPLGVAAGLAWRVVARQPKRRLGRWLCNELQMLGPTYVKMGQFMSSRKDVFGDELANELQSLRDHVVPMPEEQVRQALHAQALQKHLKDIDVAPIASASIAQVHVAKLRKPGTVGGSSSGEQHTVAVKLRRPGITDRLRDDIAFLRGLLDAASLASVENVTEASGMLDDFERAVMREVDFRAEAANLQNFRDVMSSKAGSGSMVVPELHAHLCTEDVLVMQYVPSIALTDFTGDRKRVARQVMSTFVRQLTTTGLVHGDPHGGNLRLTPDGSKLVLYDFGSMLRIEQQDRQRMKELIYYLLANNKPAVVSTMRSLGIQVIDEPQLHAYIDVYIQYLRTLDVRKFQELASSNHSLPFKLTGQMFHLIRVFGMLEGLCKELDPQFDYLGVLQQHVVDAVFDHDFLVYKSMADLGALVQAAQSGPPFSTLQQPQSQPQRAHAHEHSANAKPSDPPPVMLLAQLCMLALLLFKL